MSEIAPIQAQATAQPPVRQQPPQQAPPQQQPPAKPPGDHVQLGVGDLKQAGANLRTRASTPEGWKLIGQRTVEVAIGIPAGIVGFVVGPVVNLGRYVYKGIVGAADDDTLAGQLVDETRDTAGKLAKPLAPVAGVVVGAPVGFLQGTVEGLSYGANIGVNVGRWLVGDEGEKK